SAAERQQVLGALERLQSKLVQREEWTHSDSLGNLKETLQSPLFNHILTLQHSINLLRHQLSSLPPDACSDFSFSKKGQLIIGPGDPASSPSSVLTNGSLVAPPIHQTPPISDLLQKWILTAAKVGGARTRSQEHIVCMLTLCSLRVLLFLDGRLLERDQILVINGVPLEPGMDQQQALTLLQQPGERVELVVARDRPPPSAPSPANTGHWGHVEEIELANDGSGLGFGIVGGKSSGVVVRTLVPNSAADKDGRLRTGDHILRIGATPTTGLTSDQVVKVLQGCGGHVTMLIARDPQGQRSTAPPPPPPPDSAPVAALPPELPVQRPDHVPQRRVSKTPNLEGYEIHEVPLTKEDGQSLGISIIGYNHLTSHDAVGVFVKHVVPGSAADQSGNIRLDGVSLQALTNQEVLEVMKQTGQTVVLTVVRKKPRALERSLDKVERESSHVSLRRSLEVKSRSSGLDSMTTKLELMHLNAAQLTKDDAELQKSSKLLPVHTLRLGVELDSFDGHHYISSVAPGGPVDRHGALRPEDELLEEVPPPFTLVCCRHPTSDLEPESEPESQAEPTSGRGPAGGLEPSLDEIEMKLSSMLCSQTVLRDDRRDEEQQEVTQEEQEDEEQDEEDEDEEELDEDEDEDEEELALWSPHIQTLELQKERDKGLGFSILDYQDPLDPGRCVMVIRSLVAGGSAERDGGLLPGDQLVSVNQTQLDFLSLAQAVEVLKSAPPGTVHLGIRKPLVGSGGGSVVPENLRPEEEEEEEELILDGGLPRYTTSSLTSDLLPLQEGREMAVDEEEEEREEERIGSLPRKPPPSWEEWKLSSSGRVGPEEEEEEEQRSERDSIVSEGNQMVEVWAEEDQSLGLSIVGGRHVIKRLRNGEELKGIFIKQVLPKSPAAKSRCLKTGDKILEVSGVDLRAASHQEAVSAIKSAPSPIVFIVQSLCATPRVRAHNKPHSSQLQSTQREEERFSERWCERYADLQGELLSVELEKERQGLGLSLAGNRDRSLLSIFVVGLHPGGAAARDGRIRVGDELLEINNQILYGRSHQNASAIIKSAASKVKLILLRWTPPPRQPDAPPFIIVINISGDAGHVTGHVSSCDRSGDGSCVVMCCHVTGHVSSCVQDKTSDELEHNSRNRSNIGAIQSLREDDAFRKDAILVHEVYEEGAAARDTRLWAGDQILEVNGVDLRGASHEEAIAALRQTPAKVRLTVLRDEAQYRDEENLDLFEVELQKRSGRGLGLSIVGKRSGSGVFISEVVRGGAAELDGRLMQGDQILSVNGDDTRHASQETVAAILKGATDSLGVSIAGGRGSPLGDIPIFIAMIQANGVAAKTHQLKVEGVMSS
ncbi:hypothetical protein F2P81_005129, partial [Scophthalmus maximus]